MNDGNWMKSVYQTCRDHVVISLRRMTFPPGLPCKVIWRVRFYKSYMAEIGGNCFLLLRELHRTWSVHLYARIEISIEILWSIVLITTVKCGARTIKLITLINIIVSQLRTLHERNISCEILYLSFIFSHDDTINLLIINFFIKARLQTHDVKIDRRGIDMIRLSRI